MNPVQWHDNRRKNILEAHPEIKELYGYDCLQIFYIFFIPLLNIFGMYCSSLVNIWLTILLAATIGAFCRLRIFNITHEVCHDLVHKNLKGRLKNFVMLIMQTPSLGLFYPYYRWFHASHHGNLGLQSEEEANELQPVAGPADGDMFGGGFVSIKIKKSDKVAYLNPWFKSPFKRVVWFGFLFPLKKLTLSVLIYIKSCYDIIKLLIFWKKTERRRKYTLFNFFYYKFVNFIGIVATIYFWGWNTLIYMIFAELFLMGLLFHPCLAFWIGIHKSHDLPNGCQPTTSIYGKLMDFICGGVNYHVEHHDFLRIPTRKLKKLHDITDHYDPLFKYKSPIDFYKNLLKDDLQWYYACQNHAEY